MLQHYTDHLGIWREMEHLVNAGKIKSIGVSNWNSDQLEGLSAVAKIPIAVCQVECSAYFQQRRLRVTLNKLGIRLMAYASLGSPGEEEITNMRFFTPRRLKFSSKFAG